MIPRPNINLLKKIIVFQREFYFRERFEKRVFSTNPLSRTDTFGTHCMYSAYIAPFSIRLFE